MTHHECCTVSAVDQTVGVSLVTEMEITAYPRLVTLAGLAHLIKLFYVSYI